MHILIIPSEHFTTQENPLGGIFQLHQAKALSNKGHKVGVVSIGYITPRYIFSKYNYKKEEQIEGINVYRRYKQLYFPHRYMPFKLLKKKYIKMGIKIYEDYEKKFGKPDIIHAHNFLYAGLIAQTIKEKYNIPFIITEHSSSFVRNKLNDLKIDAIRKCSNDTIKTTAVGSAFAKVLENFTNTPVDILPNVVDNFFLDSDFINKESEDFVFLNIANLDKNKNQELIIKAFANKFKDSNVKLKIGGSGFMLQKLESLVSDLQVWHQVEFLGKLTQTEVRNEMHNANCFILASNYETFGVVLIEALACGTPCIATRCGGPEDIINHDNGILVEVGNQSELEGAMKYMLDNYKLYKKETLRRDVKNRFGEEAFVKNAMKYYKLGLENDHYN